MPLPKISCTRNSGRIGLTAAAARKALQDSLHEDEGEDDDDEQRYLNLNEEEGDVWDDNSAYIEMLAKEVRIIYPPSRLCLVCVGTDFGRLPGCRASACARWQSEESTTAMVARRTYLRKRRLKKNSASSRR
jgi:hypothetical protein